MPDEQNLTGPSIFAHIRRHKPTVIQATCLFFYYLLGKHLPGPPTPFCTIGQLVRRLLCRQIFRKMGKNVRVHESVHFGSGLNICIGDNSALAPRGWIANDTVIGRDVMMAPEVTILSATHKTESVDTPMRLQDASLPKPVTIADDVWLGTRVIILPGVTIGAHSIVGAGSVVTKDVPEFAVVAGNPARLIRHRRHPDS